MAARHLLHNTPVVYTLLRTALRSALAGKPAGGAAPDAADRPVLTATLPPRPPGLVHDYIRTVGGNPSWYRGTVPPHLFPQWGFPILARTMDGLPYDFTRLLNAGCRIEINGPLPADERLELTATLAEIDDDGRRVLFHQRLVTSTASAPAALVCKVTSMLPAPPDPDAPKSDSNKQDRAKKDKPRVPVDARELHHWRLRATAGRDFALLTGDINPIHWSSMYARMAGFRSVILHGFCQLARCIESLNGQLLSGDPRRLAAIDVRFVRPLPLPAKVGVYLDGHGGCFVGDAPGGPAYLSGTYELHGSDPS